jgi:isopentenyl phosphate kinase
MPETIFLKLGGSLITNKDQAHTALIDQIDAIGKQIKQYCQENPENRLLLGHGSGSFGHVAARNSIPGKEYFLRMNGLGFLKSGMKHIH